MPIAKSILLFCLRSAAFSAIFWTMWMGIIRPLTTSSQTGNSSSQDAQTKAQMEMYANQVERTNRQLDVSEDLQRRTDQLLSAQEDNARRMDAVLKEWERQAGLRK